MIKKKVKGLFCINICRRWLYGKLFINGLLIVLFSSPFNFYPSHGKVKKIPRYIPITHSISIPKEHSNSNIKLKRYLPNTIYKIYFLFSKKTFQSKLNIIKWELLWVIVRLGLHRNKKTYS